ncbi:proline-rich extensin-like protein EPR1 [Drosophila madeirensis]|uniref:Proline-rich extensin-like protein EPR1 n=1 Tax=Drosophila madeirensis TaxID=30013 RepID=A0AAU9FLZ7_DROMD
MVGYLVVVALLCLSATTCRVAGEAGRLRFPRPARVKSFPLILQRQDDAAPYPPAGPVPNPPFELATEEAAVFPEPDDTYGPPADVYGPPVEVYGPPAEVYGPPDQAANDDSTNSLPQSAAIINLASLPLPPQAQFVLPLLNRLAAFRPQRPVLLTPQRRPAKLTARPVPQRKPAKIVNGIQGHAVFPSIQLALPFVDRSIPFRPRPARLIVNAPLRRPVRDEHALSQF